MGKNGLRKSGKNGTLHIYRIRLLTTCLDLDSLDWIDWLLFSTKVMLLIYIWLLYLWLYPTLLLRAMSPQCWYNQIWFEIIILKQINLKVATLNARHLKGKKSVENSIDLRKNKNHQSQLNFATGCQKGHMTVTAPFDRNHY